MHLNNTRHCLQCLLLLCSLCLVGACAAKEAGKEQSTGLPPSEDTAPYESRMLTSLPASSTSVYPHLGATSEESLDDYDQPLVTLYDPLEPWNRFWFRFNDIFYLYIVRPTYTGYEAITPSEFRTGLKNLLAHLFFPVRFVNSLLQGKFDAAGVEFGRFMINSTVGFGGLIDVAKGAKTVVAVDPSGEDFGQTLGTWGINQGFYVVWPFIGPSSARDSVGLAADSFLDPLFYLRPWEAAFVASGSLRFNSMGDVLTLYEDMNKSAVDPYVAMREAYASYRKLRLRQ